MGAIKEEQALASGYEQKNTRGTRSVVLPSFSVCFPRDVIGAASMLNELSSSRVLQRAQQVLFLPCFTTTDHIFHGEFRDSTDPREGFASIRGGHVVAAHFRLYVTENYNSRDTQVYLISDDPENNRAYLNLQLLPGIEEEDSKLATWLDRELFTPLRDELMVYQKSVPEE